MKTIHIRHVGEAPQIVLGCMRIGDMAQRERSHLLATAIENGVSYFDHADIYGGGNCETVFAQSLKECGIHREDVILQSKCGIRNGFFDFSKEHILTSVDGILKRLDTPYLDVLLLHRPDTLMEPEEVAERGDDRLRDRDRSLLTSYSLA